MALRPVHHDELDSLLREAFDAERAGVFASTPVDVAGLMTRPAGSPMLRIARYVLAGLPVAAALALFLGVAASWKADRPSGGSPLNGNGSISAAGGDVLERCQTLENLRACLGGPGVRARIDCLCVDLDGDGDVDLRDRGMFELEGPGR